MIKCRDDRLLTTKTGVYSKNYNVQKYIFNIEIFISTVS